MRNCSQLNDQFEICDPLCEKQAEVQKSHSEIMMRINFDFGYSFRMNRHRSYQDCIFTKCSLHDVR